MCKYVLECLDFLHLHMDLYCKCLNLLPNLVCFHIQFQQPAFHDYLVDSLVLLQMDKYMFHWTQDQVHLCVDTSYIDYTFYYEVFDNDLLTFDFGITARDLDSQINVVEQVSAQSSDLSVSGIVPLLYVNTIIGLPFTGLNVFAEANFLSYDSNTIYDYQIGVSYALLDNLAVDLDLTVGYRAVKLELNDIDHIVFYEKPFLKFERLL